MIKKVAQSKTQSLDSDKVQMQSESASAKKCVEIPVVIVPQPVKNNTPTSPLPVNNPPPVQKMRSFTASDAKKALSILGIPEEAYVSYLHKGALCGVAELVNLLLAAGTESNVADEDGDTPLYFAAVLGHTECVKLLLEEADADVNRLNMDADTPLHAAARNGDAECINLLLKVKNINANSMNDYGETPLYVASAFGHAECVELLLKVKGVKVDRANNDDETPLYAAALNGYEECVALLLQMPDVNVNRANNDDETPLYAAALNGYEECVALLLKMPDVKVDAVNKKGETPLHAAAAGGHAECVENLLEKAPSVVNLRDRNGYTPLQVAAMGAHTECVSLLLSCAGLDLSISRNWRLLVYPSVAPSILINNYTLLRVLMRLCCILILNTALLLFVPRIFQDIGLFYLFYSLAFIPLVVRIWMEDLEEYACLGFYCIGMALLGWIMCNTDYSPTMVIVLTVFALALATYEKILYDFLMKRQISIQEN